MAPLMTSAGSNSAGGSSGRRKSPIGGFIEDFEKRICYFKKSYLYMNCVLNAIFFFNRVQRFKREEEEGSGQIDADEDYDYDNYE